MYNLDILKHNMYCFRTESRERYGCIMLDVDCKDRSLGISCPPPNFLEPNFIQSVKQCLNPQGKSIDHYCFYLIS
jgi:hypothetical protein